MGDIGQAQDAQQIQNSVVRVDGQRSVYLPVLKQGGDSNIIEIVNGIKRSVGDLLDVPKGLVAKVVFDQSMVVKTAIRNLGSEGSIGLVLTAPTEKRVGTLLCLWDELISLRAGGVL